MGDPTRRRETLYLPSFSRMRQFSRSCLKTMRIPPKKKGHGVPGQSRDTKKDKLRIPALIESMRTFGKTFAETVSILRRSHFPKVSAKLLLQ